MFSIFFLPMRFGSVGCNARSFKFWSLVMVSLYSLAKLIPAGLSVWNSEGVPIPPERTALYLAPV